MKTIKRLTLRLFVLVLALCGAAAAAQAQTVYPAQLQIDSLEPLSAKAEKIVDVSLPESLLKIIPISLLDKSHDPNAKEIKEIVAGLRGVYVKDFEFTSEGTWTQADIAPIRAQLKAPGWTRFV